MSGIYRNWSIIWKPCVMDTSIFGKSPNPVTGQIKLCVKSNQISGEHCQPEPLYIIANILYQKRIEEIAIATINSLIFEVATLISTAKLSFLIDTCAFVTIFTNKICKWDLPNLEFNCLPYANGWDMDKLPLILIFQNIAIHTDELELMLPLSTHASNSVWKWAA